MATERKQQLLSCRLVNSERRLLDLLDGKYGQGNFEIKVSLDP